MPLRVIADRRMEEVLTDALPHTVLLAYLISETVAERGLGRRPFLVRQKLQRGSILRRGEGSGRRARRSPRAPVCSR